MKRYMFIVLSILGLFLFIFGFYGLLSQKKADNGVNDISIDTLSSSFQLSDNERKGQQFEDYIISRFAPADYSLVEKVNDYTSRHHVTERSKYADLVFRKIATGEEFAVECKYRSGWIESKGKPALFWVNQKKIDDYNQFSADRDIDVIVVFGVGGTPDHPEEVFSLPLRLLQKPLPQYQDFLRSFKVADESLEYNARQHNLTTI